MKDRGRQDEKWHVAYMSERERKRGGGGGGINTEFYSKR